MDANVQVREVIKDRVKTIDLQLQAIQRRLLQSVDDKLAAVRSDLQALAQLVPEHQFYRYTRLYTSLLQTLCFVVAWQTYLASETVVTPEQVAERIGLPVELDHEIAESHIPLENLLHGLVQLPSELMCVRCVNCAAQQDCDRPLRIRAFVQELYSGFQLLNLKNDPLRRHYDVVKYDAKKIEEVVCDIKLRQLSRQS
ncbi:hypothetical protein AMAG_01357 [Allomyces macrogynus ATCC 38327]|uniref:Translin n=1 Tax=Allomyces macrogynus (strain ATCC 38327) TaxID=578462 RepID=A0A0L0RZH1_ALLM3|nr:hypothetical protein AMAG_01357 [Allomyces macrogynus ATCC 38327]|eukprot:KNE55466.1 hypothetical protein AMAG_01357 [Allomyces macrogynus ATCC 38327]